jgi:hypothetical protein
MVKGGDRCSAFLWADEIVSRIENEGEREMRELQEQEEEDERAAEALRSQRGQQDEDASVGELEQEDAKGLRDWIKERKWTSDRLRRIMQKHSERLLGCRINIIA